MKWGQLHTLSPVLKSLLFKPSRDSFVSISVIDSHQKYMDQQQYEYSFKNPADAGANKLNEGLFLISLSFLELKNSLWNL